MVDRFPAGKVLSICLLSKHNTYVISPTPGFICVFWRW